MSHAESSLVVPWACPACKTRLARRDDGLVCDDCGTAYRIRQGYPDFLDGDEFAFEERRGEQYHEPFIPPPRRSVLHRLSQAMADDDFATNLTFHRAQMRRPGCVLDLGCGAGNAYYAGIGPTVGVDPAFANLRKASGHYKQLARATAESLPFPDDAFDYVVTTDVLEHLDAATKDAALREIHRVLKPGGRTLHVCPVDNRHPLTKFAKRYPDLYKREFVDRDGHIGLEMARDVLARFRPAGLEITKVRVQRGFVWSKWEIIKRFDTEYREKARWVPGLVGALSVVANRRWLNRAINPAWWLLDRVVTLPLSLDHVERVGICARKPMRAEGAA